MKVGDYVRTKKGWICKLDYYDEEFKRYITHDENDWYPVYKSEIKRYGELIDLIEVGDYVNGEKVCAIGENSGDIYIRELKEFILANEIKSIVTKEQFERMEYKI